MHILDKLEQLEAWLAHMEKHISYSFHPPPPPRMGPDNLALLTLMIKHVFGCSIHFVNLLAYLSLMLMVD